MSWPRLNKKQIVGLLNKKRSLKTQGNYCKLFYTKISRDSYIRKNHGCAMDSLNASLESEQRAKGEALRIKKKLEGTINELEIALDHGNKANAEGMKAIKRYQGQLRDTIQAFEAESRAKQQVAEQV